MKLWSQEVLVVLKTKKTKKMYIYFIIYERDSKKKTKIKTWNSSDSVQRACLWTVINFFIKSHECCTKHHSLTCRKIANFLQAKMVIIVFFNRRTVID
jgi:hypothetical protein